MLLDLLVDIDVYIHSYDPVKPVGDYLVHLLLVMIVLKALQMGLDAREVVLLLDPFSEVVDISLQVLFLLDKGDKLFVVVVGLQVLVEVFLFKKVFFVF